MKQQITKKLLEGYLEDVFYSKSKDNKRNTFCWIYGTKEEIENTIVKLNEMFKEEVKYIVGIDPYENETTNNSK